jgi:hypothetical protein
VKVKELIAQLSKLPKTYEVVLCLEAMPEHPELPPDHNQHFESVSAFVFNTGADKEHKCVYIFGCAEPKDVALTQHGNN